MITPPQEHIITSNMALTLGHDDSSLTVGEYIANRAADVSNLLDKPERGRNAVRIIDRDYIQPVLHRVSDNTARTPYVRICRIIYLYQSILNQQPHMHLNAMLEHLTALLPLFFKYGQDK